MKRGSIEHVTNHLPASKKNDIAKFKYYPEDFISDGSNDFDHSSKIEDDDFRIEHFNPDDPNLNESDKEYIRKDRNDAEVIKGVIENSEPDINNLDTDIFK